MQTCSRAADRAWADDAVRRIEADARRSADTHLLRFPLGEFADRARVALYLKDETTHPTGSLKHRLARSLFLYALCNGWVREGTTVIEASSGSTAVSEAYFAKLLGLPFVAVVPRSTSSAKIALACWDSAEAILARVSSPPLIVSCATSATLRRESISPLS